MIGKACEAGRSGSGARTMDRMLPRDRLLRRVDRLLDLGALRPALAQHYSPRGRSSVDPGLLIRMALVGRIYAIPSERRLCEELRYNLAYRWFCRLPAGAPVPHHSTFSKNRHGRFRDAGVFRLLFENTVSRCIAAGLVSTKDAAIDGSFVAADASWQRKMRDGDTTGAALPRPVRDWLADRDAAPEAAANPRRPVAAEPSRTDPAAAWTSRTVRGRFGHALNVLIDTPSGVALDVAATPARFAAEVDAGRDMLARAAERFGYRPKRVAVDTAYGSASFLAFLRDHGAIPHIPVTEASTSGPRLTSTSPVSLTAGRVRFVHNARPAGSGALLTRPTRTCGIWRAPRCRRRFTSGPCGSGAGWSACSPMRRRSGGSPGCTCAASGARRRNSRWLRPCPSSSCSPGPPRGHHLPGGHVRSSAGSATWSGSAATEARCLRCWSVAELLSSATAT